MATLSCARCREAYRIDNYSQRSIYRCPRCGAQLTPAGRPTTDTVRRKLAMRSYVRQIVGVCIVAFALVIAAYYAPGLIRKFDVSPKPKSKPSETPVAIERPSQPPVQVESRPQAEPPRREETAKTEQPSREAWEAPARESPAPQPKAEPPRRPKLEEAVAPELARAAEIAVAKGWQAPRMSATTAARHLECASQLWKQGTPVAKLFARAHAAAAKRLGVEPGTAVPEILVPTADQRAMKAIARGGDPLAPEHASVKSFEFQYYRAVVYLQSLVGTREGFDRAAKLFDEIGGRHGKALADAIRAFIMCKTCKGTGERPCSKCNGSGGITRSCPKCGGKRGNCSNCFGDGRVVNPCPPGVKCTSCGGKKVDPPMLTDIAWSLPCKYCEGRGALFAAVPSTCPACCGLGYLLLPVKNPREALVKVTDQDIESARAMAPPKPVVRDQPPQKANPAPAGESKPGTAKVTSTEGYEHTVTIDVGMSDAAAKGAKISDQSRVLVKKGSTKVGTALVVMCSSGATWKLTIQFVEFDKATLMGVKKGDALTLQRVESAGGP